MAVVSALLLTAVPLGCILRSAQDGFGEHLWNLQDGKLLPILRYIYISWVTYVVVLCLLKVSLLLFYLGVFTTPRFRKTAFCALGFILVNNFVVFFMTVFACKPVSLFWDRDIKNGRCINIQALGYTVSASAMVQDIILLALPLTFLRQLQMKRARKIGVGFMFAIGTFGTVATAMRLPSLSTFKISIDPTWDYVPVTKWSQLELAVCFICISLPSIRVLVSKIVPTSVKDFLSSKAGISKISNNSASNTTSNKLRRPDVQSREGQSSTRGTSMSARWFQSVHLASSKRQSKSTGDAHIEGEYDSTNPLWHKDNQPEDIEMILVEDSKAKTYANVVPK